MARSSNQDRLFKTFQGRAGKRDAVEGKGKGKRKRKPDRRRDQMVAEFQKRYGGDRGEGRKR